VERKANIRQQAFFLPAKSGQRFCVWRAPATGEALRGLILHAPAFAEEMNKSRRMTALAARAFALRGFGVLQVDLLGCGESSGDFGEATWDAWVDDLMVASGWMREQSDSNFWLWGLRAGALLASAAMHRLPGPTSMLLWQPTVSGKQQLTQFLRVKFASEMLSRAAEGNGTSQLRDRLLGGEPLEVAGYTVSPALAAGLDSAVFSIDASRAANIAWLEVASAARASLSPVGETQVQSLQARGIAVTGRSVRGPGFWQTTEIEECPELIDASLAVLEQEVVREVSRSAVLL